MLKEEAGKTGLRTILNARILGRWTAYETLMLRVAATEFGTIETISGLWKVFDGKEVEYPPPFEGVCMQIASNPTRLHFRDTMAWQASCQDATTHILSRTYRRNSWRATLAMFAGTVAILARCPKDGTPDISAVELLEDSVLITSQMQELRKLTTYSPLLEHPLHDTD